MKKLIVLAFVCLLVSTVAAYATGPVRFNQYQEVKIYIGGNPTINEAYQMATDAGNNILVPGARILGYTITPMGKTINTAAYFGLYDTATDPNTDPVTAFSKGNLEAEIETASSNVGQGGSKTIWLPYPYLIKYGVALLIGEYSSVTIYYEIR